jgi:hypothetical protein
MYSPLHSLLWVFAVSDFDYCGVAKRLRDGWVESDHPNSEYPSRTQERTPVIEMNVTEYVGGTLGPSDEHPDEATTRGVRRSSFETGATNPQCSGSLGGIKAWPHTTDTSGGERTDNQRSANQQKYDR